LTTTPKRKHGIGRALLSVYDKTGIVALARRLHAMGVECVSTGGTARALSSQGVPVREISELTGFPEMLDGRVKTLHPMVHGGLLAVRDDPDHMNQAGTHGIGMIDLIAINLYPFEATRAERPDDTAGCIEMIDIGGPAMIRSASKNFRHVVVLVDPADYDPVLKECDETGGISESTRARLAAKAFALTSDYDALIADFMRQASPEADAFPARLPLPLRRSLPLRYGENPHQAAALYIDPLDRSTGPVGATQVQGRDLSFNNILDLDAAWSIVCDFSRPACAIVKHNTPAGVAVGADATAAWRDALACDPVSAFGGIVAFNVEVTARAAREASTVFLEAIIAPSYEEAALEVLASKKNLRVMQSRGVGAVEGGLDFKRVSGGLLVQQRDGISEDFRNFRSVTRRRPTDEETATLSFAWTVVRHVKSNAIVFARGTSTAGIGAGQMSRVDAVRFGAQKATGPLEGSALASDAFFPFRDGVDEAARAGVRSIVQPGGSKKDEEVIAAADEHDIAMVFTGRRHFRH